MGAKIQVTRSPQELSRLRGMSEPRISYTPRHDATPEGELNALASIYRFVLDSAINKAGGVTSTSGDDAMKGYEDDGATQQYTR
jgi:hypothetical protein